MTKREKLFNTLDVISEYHPDIRPLKRDTVNSLLEKYFYWVTEYNDGYSEELANPGEDEFNAWICEKAKLFITELIEEEGN